MTLVAFMFSSPYDQAALTVMAIGMTVNGVIDIARRHRAVRTR